MTRKTLNREIMQRYESENPHDALVLEIKKTEDQRALEEQQLRKTTRHLATLRGFLMLNAASRYGT